MDRQTQAMLLSGEERAALEAAIRDICAFNTGLARSEAPTSAQFWVTPQTMAVGLGAASLAFLTSFARALGF